jgi:predicted NBD/HSP70 family sugar kinase
MTGPANQQTVRLHNRALVLARVADSPGLTRAQIALAVGLTRATVSTLVDELIASRLLVERAPAAGLRGRPGSRLELDPSGPLVVGLELNVDHTSACLLDLTGTVQGRQVLAVDNGSATAGVALRRAARLVRKLVSSAASPVSAVAVALPGLVTPAGVVRRAPNLPRWAHADIPALLAPLVDAPVELVDNEANLAALAEHWYGTGLRDYVHVSGEIGVGGALVLDGELFRGARGFAGELGHVLVDPRGPECRCGNRGCLEQVAGRRAVLLAAGAADDDALVAQAVRGDVRTRRALDSAAAALGVALGAVINTVDVPAAVLGGFYARIGAWLAEPLTAELAQRVVSGAPVQVHVSTLGADAAMLGAAGHVVRQTLATGAWPTRR